MNLERKLVLFEFLTSGLTPLKEIYNLYCFKQPNGTRVSWKVFRRGMRGLAKQKYIEIINCGDAREEYGLEAAVLLGRGADLLCTHKSLDQDHFRMTVPKIANIDHEIKLTEIVNTIKEGERQNRYVIVNISDDSQMRRIYKSRNQSLKGQYLPDLDVVISAHRTDGKEVTIEIYIEYDNGNKGGSYWSQKLKNWPTNIIAITRNRSRSERLASYLEGARLDGGICIVTLEDFKRIGLLNPASILLRLSKSIYDSKTREWKKVA